MRHGIIALLDDSGAPNVIVGAGWNEENAKSHFDRIPERAIGQIVTTKMPVVVENVATNPLFSDWPFTEKGRAESKVSFIGVPIKERDRVIGTLTIDRIWDGRANFRFDEDVRFLAVIANLVGQSVRLHNAVVRDRERLMAEQSRLAKELSETIATDHEPRMRGIIGDSEAIQSVLIRSRLSRAPIRLCSCAASRGQERSFSRVPRMICPRARKIPFIKLNCAALPNLCWSPNFRT